MERSGSQKALLVISIITIVFACLGLLASIMTIAGGAMLGSVDSAELTETLEGSGITQGEVAGMFTLGGLMLLIVSLVELIEGILGVRAANDNQKIMPVWVLTLIGIILSAIGVIYQAVQGQLLADPSVIASLILSVLLFWIANNIKVQAGK